jgi:acetyl esterase/lipase
MTDYRSDPRNRVVSRLAEGGLVVLAIDYRLARPGHPSWPAVLDDLREAVRWTRRHSSELDIDGDRIAMLGQSSGAHLAMLAATLPDEPGPDGVSARVQAVVSFYGPTDLARLLAFRRLTHEPVRTFLGDVAARTAEFIAGASPINHVSRDTPPMLFLHGSDDLWVPPEQSELMAAALERAGAEHQLIIIPGARHGFDSLVKGARDRDLQPEILALLESVWNVSIVPPRQQLTGRLPRKSVPRTGRP